MVLTFSRFNLNNKEEIEHKTLSLKDLRSKLVYDGIVGIATDKRITLEQFGSLIVYNEYFTGCYNIKYQDRIMISDIELEKDDKELAKALSYMYYRITNNTQRTIMYMEALQRKCGD